jgi:hypothetical protein
VASLREKIKIVFFCTTTAVLALFFISIIRESIQKKADEKMLSEWLNVTLSEVINSDPPGLLIDVENTGPRIVGRTHFRLVFSVGDRTVCRVDTDHGDFKPQKKRTIMLKCTESSLYSQGIPIRGKKINFVLMVFPEYKKPIDPLKGAFYLK